MTKLRPSVCIRAEQFGSADKVADASATLVRHGFR